MTATSIRKKEVEFYQSTAGDQLDTVYQVLSVKALVNSTQKLHLKSIRHTRHDRDTTKYSFRQTSTSYGKVLWLVSLKQLLRIPCKIPADHSNFL